MRLGEEKRLSPPIILKLLERHTLGSAGQVVSDTLRADGSLTDCVRALEVRYASLQHPDSARVAIGNVRRDDDEAMGDLSDRIKKLAFMSTRLVRPRPEQMKQEMELASLNLLRCLTSAIRTEMSDRIRERRMMGIPDYTYAALTAELEDLESRKKAFNKVQIAEDALDKAAQEAKLIRDGQAVPRSEPENETVKTLKELVSKQDQKLIEVIKQMGQRDYKTNNSKGSYNSAQSRNNSGSRGRSPSIRSDRNRQIRGQSQGNWQRFNSCDRSNDQGRNQNWQNNRDSSRSRERDPSRPQNGYNWQQQGDRRSRRDSPHPNSKQARAGSRGTRTDSRDGRYNPGNRIRSDSNARIDFQALNVNRNECARCGLPFHYASSGSCPLRGKTLTNRVCANCGKGGHLPMDCLSSPKN